MQPVTQYTNDLILIAAPSVAVPVGPNTSHTIKVSDDYAVEIRNLSIFCNQTAAAAAMSVYLRRLGVADTRIFTEAAAGALPREINVSFSAPLLVARGDLIFCSHGSAVTVAGDMLARINGLIIPD